jgi:hypothetical protein
VQRRSTAPLDPLANTAMLESPGCTPGCAVNAKSSNVTPIAKPVTLSAYPEALGVTAATALAPYDHDDVEQSSPPYTTTPSSDALTTTFSA